jgi:hypothetical protein
MIGIIGFGISGMIVYLSLLKRGIDPKTILIFDSDFMGGDLATKYSSTDSNTIWEKTLDALKNYEKSLTIFPTLDKNKPTSLLYLPRILQNLTQSFLNTSEVHTQRVKLVSYSSETKIWTIDNTFAVSTLFLCIGGLPKTLDIPGSWIPLSIALDKELLKRFVLQNNTYVVFGLSHSGTLVIRNLAELNTKCVAIYKTDTPFQYSKDGHYSGIKQESEDIARNIENGLYPTIKLVHHTNITEVARAIHSATAYVSCIGFEPSQIEILVDGQKMSSLKYSSETARIDSCPNCYGFGMAFPGTTTVNNKVHNDISLSAFNDQIERILSNDSVLKECFQA